MPEKETVKDRIKFYLSEKDIRISTFENSCGFSNGYVNSIRKGIGNDKLEIISKFYPDLNIEWLMTGCGSMIKRKPSYQIATPNTEINDKKEGYHKNGDSGVPYYDIDITATITESFSDVQELPEFYVDFKPFNDCSAYLPIWGDSMFPEYTAGDIVAVKRIKNFNIILPGEVYLVITNEEGNNMRTIKKVWPNPEDQASLILRSSNPKYAGDIVVPKDYILSMYVVKGKITRKQL